jgi:hypothetical protein
MNYQIAVNKMVTEDNYKEGEIGLTTDHGYITKLEVTDLANAPLEIAQFIGCNVDELTVYENQIEYQRLENDHAEQATDLSIAIWKEGKRQLWSANYQCYITEVSSKEVTNKELIALGLVEA